MAKFKCGSVVTDVSGSLGGHTFQRSHGGMQLRTKPVPPDHCSYSQSLIRSLNHQLQKGWRDLTDAQRQVWNDWAISHNIQAERMPHNPISGHSLWMKYQYGRLIVDLPFISHPSKYLVNYFGTELISDNYFSNPGYWVLGAGWSISSNKAIANGINSLYGPRKQLSLSVGSVYLNTIIIDIFLNGSAHNYMNWANHGPSFNSTGLKKSYIISNSALCWCGINEATLVGGTFSYYSIKQVFNY